MLVVVCIEFVGGERILKRREKRGVGSGLLFGGEVWYDTYLNLSLDYPIPIRKFPIKAMHQLCNHQPNDSQT